MPNQFMNASAENAKYVFRSYRSGESNAQSALVQSHLAIAYEMQTANLLEFAKQLEDPTQKAVIFEIINERLDNLI